MPLLSSISSRILTGIGQGLTIPSITPANQIITDWDPRTRSFITRPTNSNVTEFFVSSGGSWISRTLPQLYISQISNIRYYNGFVYAVVRTNSSVFTRDIYRSSDYQNWTLVYSTGLNTNWSIDINPSTGRFLITSGAGTNNALISPNGVDWAPITLPAAATNLRFGQKGWNGNVVVAANFGSSTDHLYRSLDNGFSWTSVATNTTWAAASAVSQFTQSVANNGTRFIAVLGQGARNMSISTDNGATWGLPQTNQQWPTLANSIFFSTIKNKFVVTSIGGDSSVVSYSPDGVVGNWTNTATLPSSVTTIIETDTRVYGSSTGTAILDITDLI